MKDQADKSRQEREFQVGDWVYVKLQPHIQDSVQRRSNHKLNYKYFGPYLILQTVGKVAYKIQLPATRQIHPVLHVSLKKALPPDVSLSTDDELLLLLTMDSLPPSQVLAERLSLVGRHVTPSLLVQRESCPMHWATWEPAATMSDLIPRALATATTASRGRVAT